MTDEAVAALPPASALSGSELFYADNGSGDVKVTANQLKAFASGSGGTSEANKLSGRGDTGPGNLEPITLGDGLEMDGTTLNASAAIPSSGTDPLALVHGLSVSTTNPTVGGDPGLRRAVRFSNITDSSTSYPNFANEETVQIDLTALHGQCTNNATTSAKKTFIPLNIGATYNASGQKFIMAGTLLGYGMGDTATYANLSVQYAGGPVAGDEGMGWQLASVLGQQPYLNITTIANIPTQSTYTATVTQYVPASTSAQTVTVSSTTGAVVGDWIVIGQETPSGAPNSEAVRITAVGVGTITAIFYFNHNSGATILPALVIDVVSSYQMGQDRVLVNMSAPSYSTGTVASFSGGGFTGSGTSWANNMVGGNALNIGAISLAADDYTGTPFDSGANRLKSWFQIPVVTNATSLAIHSYSVAADGGYNGKGPGDGTYIIRPCVRVLRLDFANGGRLICEYSTSPWTVGDTVEQVICPYADVTGFLHYVKAYTNGGTYRAYKDVRNEGARKFSVGINLSSDLAWGTGGLDDAAWGIGYAITNCNYGLSIHSSTIAAITLDAEKEAGIYWGPAGDNNLSIRPDVAGTGLRIRGTNAALGGNINIGSAAPGTYALMDWGGIFKVIPATFNYFPAATADLTGAIGFVTNSTTGAPGAIIAGGGGRAVMAYCDGTDWRVMGTDRTTISRDLIVPLGTNAKLGGTGTGWVFGADDALPLVTLPAGQTTEVFICCIPGLEVGDVVTGVGVVGQIESAGNTASLTVDLRKVTAAAADIADASLLVFGPLSVTADTEISPANLGYSPMAEIMAANESLYMKLTGTTAAATDIALMSLIVTVQRAR